MTTRYQRAAIGAVLVVAATGWILACSSGDITVNPGRTPKSVTVVGATGSGHVVSSDGNLDCQLTAGVATGAKCTASYDSGTVVSITATPDADQDFKTWGGDCSTGTGTCRLTVTRNMTASATFVRAVETLSLELATSATDDGAAIIRIDGPSILGITGTAGLELATRPAGTATATSKTIMVRGNLTSGVIARFNIRGLDLGGTYSTTVLSVAGRASSGYAQRQNLSAYTVAVKQ